MRKTRNVKLSCMNMRGMRRGYTMEDVLIVMLLLVLIAATAAPRFSKACDDAKLPSMMESLHRIRSQIQVYRMEHDGLLPGQCVAGEDISCESFVKALTESEGEGKGYLKEMPANPFVGDDSADDITIVNSFDAICSGTEGTGWWFNIATAEFCASDSKFHSVY